MKRRHRTAFPFDQAKTSHQVEDMPQDLKAYCQKWTLRALIDLGAHTNLLHEGHCSDPGLMVSLDLGVTLDEAYEYPRVLQALRQKHREVVSGSMPVLSDGHLTHNIHWLASELGLSAVDQSILLFCVLERQNVYLRQTMASLGEMSTARAMTVLSVLLEIPLQEVYKALACDSVLVRSGLLSIDENNIFDFANKVELIHGINERITVSQDSPFDIFADNFVVAPAPELATDDFQHLGDKWVFLQKYLAHASKFRDAGVNVLLYGAPGTGKTQLARVMAHQLGLSLFEVALENRNGDRIHGNNRLSAYRLSQRILSKRQQSLIVFDEIEDINSPLRSEEPEFFGRRSNRSGQKGWINQLLEQNSVPAIWITNNIRFLDPAHLRRFDYHLHLDIPPVSVRSAMLSNFTKDLHVTHAWCDTMAANALLSPALMARSTKVARAIGQDQETPSMEVILDHVVGAALRAQNQSFARPAIKSKDVGYDLSVVNADCNLFQLIEGLRSTQAGRVCLYGPPGTGKSAFAQHVATVLGKPVVLKRASDVLGPFVGETESRMAAMFQEATEKEGVLILDEADTFLRTRDGAQRSWEVSSVNEMLTQMEAFAGIFFCTTNLMDRLDEASLRRFDLKINFSYLKPEHVLHLFEDVSSKLNLTAHSRMTSPLKALDKLTPGDFSNVMRQSRLHPIHSAQDLLERLVHEMKLKKNTAMGPMGFLGACV